MYPPWSDATITLRVYEVAGYVVYSKLHFGLLVEKNRQCVLSFWYSLPFTHSSIVTDD